MDDKTIKDLVAEKLGEEAASTLTWALTGILGVMAIGLVIWTIVAFGKMATESDMNQKKAKKKHAINLLIVSFVAVIIASSVAPIFLAIPVGQFSPDGTNTALLLQSTIGHNLSLLPTSLI